MTEIYEFGINLLSLTIDLLTLALLAGVFYVIGLALVTMARNRQPRWQNIAYVLIILGSGLALLRWYPQKVIVSMREAIQEARPEAEMLRGELESWLPALPAGFDVTPTIAVTPGETAILSVLTPAPPPMATPIPPAAPTAVPSPIFTATLRPSPTPTPCMLIINGTQWACPPTPATGGVTWP